MSPIATTTRKPIHMGTLRTTIRTTTELSRSMSVTAVLSPELHNLAARLGALLGRSGASADALRMVVQRAPDERLAVVALLKLAELSAPALIAALEDPKLAADLVFCLGSSEIAGAFLCAEPGWLEVFAAARNETAATLRESIRLRLEPPFSRARSGPQRAALNERS